MKKFKVGDKIRMRRRCCGIWAGEICVLYMYHGELFAVAERYSDTQDTGCSCQHLWELVEEKAKDIIVYGIVKFCKKHYI